MLEIPLRFTAGVWIRLLGGESPAVLWLRGDRARRSVLGGGPRRESARSACGESRATSGEGPTPGSGFGLSGGVPARRR